jgi:hypothetical protein
MSLFCHQELDDKFHRFAAQFRGDFEQRVGAATARLRYAWWRWFLTSRRKGITKMPAILLMHLC